MLKAINEYDRRVCQAVQHDPFGFIDILISESNTPENKKLAPLLREAACVIANLMAQLNERVDWEHAE